MTHGCVVCCLGSDSDVTCVLRRSIRYVELQKWHSFMNGDGSLALWRRLPEIQQVQDAGDPRGS